MHNLTQLKLLFLINPVSGGKGKEEWESAIRQYFKDSSHSIHFYLLSKGNDAASIKHYLTTLKPDRVIAVGGDGTVKLAAEILKETRIPLAILPAGSANGMAKELNIPLIPEEALRIVVEGVPTKIDLIKINEEELSIHLSDIGLNAMIVKYFDESASRGWLSYGKALLRVLWEKQKFRCTITTEAGKIKRQAYMVVLANARQYGMGGTINPDGNIADSFFEVVIVRKLNVFAVLNGIIRKKSFDPQKIEIIKTTHVEITTQRKAHFQVDGEYLGKVAHIKARILPQVLTLILPPSE